MKRFGLIGYPLGHSFSKKYFTEKFEKEHITDCGYELYPLESIDELPNLIKSEKGLVGLNVTIPYKEQVLKYLDDIDPKAASIGAVNCIKIQGKKLIGYNTDYIGFRESLLKFLGPNSMPEKALILGTGGASKAVKVALEDLGIAYQFVSRNPSEGELSYEDLKTSKHHNLNTYKLVVNTTPLGMAPHTDALPELPYHQLTEQHYLYDLVYNPLKTAFMQKGIDAKCWVKNGLEMLYGQAAAAWEIWDI